MKAKAWEIAGDPELYNRVWKIGKNSYECEGYSRTGYNVRFLNLIPTDDHKLIVVMKYIDPDKELEEVKEENEVPEKNPAAVSLGKLGGKSRSDAKRKASAENGKKGGRPRKQTE